MADDDDDEGGLGGMFEDGHWAWDDGQGILVFVSDLPVQQVETIQMLNKAPTGTIEFRDDIDLIEQIRFRRRYQRKLQPGQADVITLQDVKDIALFTAPVYILSPMLINSLHLSTTERFLRALILYLSYYLQIEDEVAQRILEKETRIRTKGSEMVENEYSDNLADLRLLVAKEYSAMIIGGADTKKLHHMGPQKKSRSLSDKDARLYETLLRMAVQIVWLALGRKSFNQIELEVSRIFKTEIFNSTEHMLKTGYVGKMSKEKRTVLFGPCVRHDQKLNTRSPLMNELFCYREIDYRMMGLGIIKCPQMSSRLHYMYHALTGPEETLKNFNMTLGIIGMPRSSFDTMLRILPEAKSKGSASTLSMKFGSPSKASTKSVSSAASKASTGSVKKSQTVIKKTYPDIVLPPKETHAPAFPKSFPDTKETILKVSETQRRRWQNRLTKLMHPNR